MNEQTKYPGEECGLSEEEWKLEQVVNEIRSLSTLEGIGVLWQVINGNHPIVGALSRSGGVWVNAETRLPDIYNKPIPAKLDTNYGVLTRFETHIEFSGRGFFQSFHDKHTEDFKQLFWLNESPAADKGDAIEQTVSMEEYNHAIEEIGQLQEQLRDVEEMLREAYRELQSK